MNTYLICNYTLVYILYNYIFLKLIYHSTCTTITLSVGYNWHTKHWPTFLKIFKMTCKLFLVIRIFLIFGKKFLEIHYHFIQSYLKVSNLIEFEWKSKGQKQPYLLCDNYELWISGPQTPDSNHTSQKWAGKKHTASVNMNCRNIVVMIWGILGLLAEIMFIRINLTVFSYL